MQLIHRAAVRALMQDLADATQPRFTEMAAAERVIEVAASVAVAASESRTGGAFHVALASLTPVQRQAHAEAAVLRETSTVFAALIGWLVLKETVGPRRIALMALIALGAVIVEMGG